MYICDKNSFKLHQKIQDNFIEGTVSMDLCSILKSCKPISETYKSCSKGMLYFALMACLITGDTMKIVLDDGTTKELQIEKALIEDILTYLKINPVEVIVAKNGKITTECDLVQSTDQLKIIRIIHGG
jgi:sulfur carrier protein ThiS